MSEQSLSVGSIDDFVGDRIADDALELTDREAAENDFFFKENAFEI